MQAALRLVAQRVGSVPAVVADDFRTRVNAAVAHLEEAFTLWRQHMEERAAGIRGAWKTRRRSRSLVRQSRRQWKGAVRMLAA
jgi:hypothetical protein